MDRFLSCHWLSIQSFLPHSTLTPLCLHEINCYSLDVPDWLQSSTFVSPASRLLIGSLPTSSTDQTKNSANTLLMHKLPSLLLQDIVDSDSEVPVPENTTQEKANLSSKVLINTPQINIQPAEPGTSSVKPPPIKHLHKIPPIPRLSHVTAKHRIKKTAVLLTSIDNRNALKASLEKIPKICIEKIEEDVQSVKREIGEVKGEVERKIEEVEDKVQGKIEEFKEKVQVKIGDLEKRLSELKDRPINFPANPHLTYSRPTVKSLKFDGQTSWTVFKTQFDVVSSANGWNNRVKASQLVASLRGTAAEVLQGIPSDKLTDLMTIENALEARFGDSNLTQFYRTELKTRRQKPGESLQVLAADVERLMSLAYAEFPQVVRDSLAAQYFVDAIRDEDTQHATKVSALCGERNGLYLEGSICGISSLMLVDTGANVTLVRTDLAQKLKGNFIYTAPNISLNTTTIEKAEIHGKLDAAIE
ncbi:hypothetical protein AVEN_122179-1 [Araneus ventricosus]|uniref:Peptidase A2 domain-containing protein n=1 Tax=Araneus ventricosus TaxID=182803 RepID=A0A4Y2FBY2_ARAVE|nr:hypothetical protein AVEN_122179-1 [Araneus ventricosus]